jgi:hypothetical protein
LTIVLLKEEEDRDAGEDQWESLRLSVDPGGGMTRLIRGVEEAAV